MTDSWPDPGPHTEIIRSVAKGTPNDSDDLDAEKWVEVIHKQWIIR